MADYGIPYMGSKDSIVHKISALFPPAENFYDLFGGGFSMMHYLLLLKSDRYQNFYFNEPAPGVVDLIKDAISGKFNYRVFKPPFVGREEFFKKKETDAYTRIVWSFGNNQRGYLFGKDIEDYKRSLHNAVIFDNFDATAINALGIMRWPKGATIKGKRFFIRKTVKQRRGELQQLERLERLQQLERLERLEFSSLDYRQVKIKPNSIIYCDPPYQGKAEYLDSFDHNIFWGWAMSQPEPVFVSEYTAPKYVPVVMAIRKKARLSPFTTNESVEKLFANEAAKRLLK